ncbi:hypothetical protein HanHA300_Chr03g0091901 [Helianthus annuus]|nr:hypothetical protein HanHA300_Chr03g0091901 [Helianthus annuus]
MVIVTEQQRHRTTTSQPRGRWLKGAVVAGGCWLRWWMGCKGWWWGG